MPKGVGIVIAVLVVIVGGVGLWIWLESGGGVSTSSETARAGGGSPSQETASAPGAEGAPSAGGSFESGADPDQAFEENEVLVIDPPESFPAGLAGTGYRVIEQVTLQALDVTVYRVSIPSGRTVQQAKSDLAATFPGVTVDANHHFESQAGKNFTQSTARALIGWKPAKAACGKGVRLGMIDASVDVNHEALKGQDVKFQSFHKKGRRPGPADHGTAVAAILVGKSEWGGLLPGASLKAANMFEKNKTGRVVGNALALLKSVNWLAGQKVHVINMSVAGADNKAIRVAMKKAMGRRMVMVAAAGNWGREDRPAFPAAYKDVVAVTAVSKDRKVYGKANKGKYIDFAAPGVSVYTAVPSGGRLQSGTSFAVPYISAIMAMSISKGTRKNPKALRKVVQQSIVDLGSPGKDKTFGWGLVSSELGC